MTLKLFLDLVEKQPTANYTAVCSDKLGLRILLPQVLNKIATAPDIEMVDARSLTVERTRQLSADLGLSPRGSSIRSQVVVWSTSQIPAQCVGPLLKVMEESSYARFILQTQHLSKRVSTLVSRTIVGHLPFLSKRVVLGNLSRMHVDAQVADDLNLYDGTLAGTVEAVRMKEAVLAVQRELQGGARGLIALLKEEEKNPLVFDKAVEPFILEEERAYLRLGREPYRRQLVLARIVSRGKK